MQRDHLYCAIVVVLAFVACAFAFSVPPPTPSSRLADIFFLCIPALVLFTALLGEMEERGKMDKTRREAASSGMVDFHCERYVHMVTSRPKWRISIFAGFCGSILAASLISQSQNPPLLRSSLFCFIAMSSLACYASSCWIDFHVVKADGFLPAPRSVESTGPSCR